MSRVWWKESVVYQIYPRSFCDSNGDGIGDLRGIISKLDYLQALGIDVVWLSPVYQSPNDDNGYDISDYQVIMAEFGTLADWEELLAGLHSRGIKLIMDLVVNHSSDEHAWFVASRSARDNPKRDYYLWRDGKKGQPPNNWTSFFSGSAWEYDQATDQYYLHLFSRKQPDLNWENPQVRDAVFDMMTWWLDKGIDGFRMDVINMIGKQPQLPDTLAVPEYFDAQRLNAHLSEMKQRVLSKYDILTVGEMPMVPPEQAAHITDVTQGYLNMLFQFEHVELDTDFSQGLGKWGYKPLSLVAFKQSMTRWQTGLEGRGWNSLYLSNHDQPRQVSRFGNDGAYRIESAKMLATCMHLLQGTPYIYQGEELGMTNVRFGHIDDYRDIETLNMYQDFVGQRGMAVADVMPMIYHKGRDNARTPMQWDDSAHAGFTSGVPWIALNPNYTDINAAAARADKHSVFHYYRQLISLRKQHPVMVYGRYDLLLEDHPEIYAYTRTLEDEVWLVICHVGVGAPVFECPEALAVKGYQPLIGNYDLATGLDLRALVLRPYEAQVLRLK